MFVRHVCLLVVIISDLDLASLKAVSAMLKGLSLQPNVRENDFMEEKTKLFKKSVSATFHLPTFNLFIIYTPAYVCPSCSFVGCDN